MSRPSYPPRSAGDLCASGEVPRPVFGVDIDGTLGVYHAHFTQFASAWIGKDLPPADEYEGGPFHAHLGLSKSTYRRIKLAYRRGGLKRSMPLIPGADSLVDALRSRGALVVLCTTRPYLSVENIDEDTRHWAKRNRVRNDGILWGPHKYRDLVRAYGKDRIVGVIDDEPDLCRQAGELGIQWLAHRQPYNEELNPFRYTLWEAQNTFSAWLDQWELRQQ